MLPCLNCPYLITLLLDKLLLIFSHCNDDEMNAFFMDDFIWVHVHMV